MLIQPQLWEGLSGTELTEEKNTSYIIHNDISRTIITTSSSNSSIYSLHIFCKSVQKKVDILFILTLKVYVAQISQTQLKTRNSSESSKLLLGKPTPKISQVYTLTISQINFASETVFEIIVF